MESNKTASPALPPGFTEQNNIIYGVSDGCLLHIKIHRPEKKNAFLSEMYETIRI